MSITFDDFKKLEIRIGRVISAEKVEGADKLLKLQVDFGPSAGSGSLIRQIVSGIAQFYTPESLIGKEFPFIVNLEPRVIRSVESQGMIMAVDNNGEVVLLNPDKEVIEGSVVK